MASLSDLLQESYHFDRSDFGPKEGEVFVDSGKGTITPQGRTNAKEVMLNDLFKVGQYVCMDMPFEHPGRLRFVVLDVNSEGIDAVSSRGERGFLPWEVMAHALERSRHVYVDVLSELEDLTADEKQIVDEEIGRLRSEIRHHRTALAALSDELSKLEGIEERPTPGSPTSWLRGG